MNEYKTAETEPCVPCRERRHEDCTENYCTCGCPATAYIEARVTIPRAAYDDLLEDLDSPVRPSKLRDLM